MKVISSIVVVLCTVVCTVTLALVIHLHYVQAKEVEAYLLYDNTAIIYSGHVVSHATFLINRQAIVIDMQRRVIKRMATSPCAERMLLTFRDHKRTTALLRGKAANGR